MSIEYDNRGPAALADWRLSEEERRLIALGRRVLRAIEDAGHGGQVMVYGYDDKIRVKPVRIGDDVR